MIKFRWYYDKDKEEEFLNNMVEKGYAMRSFSLGLYKFDRCIPGEFTYRIDSMMGKNKEQKKEFYDLIEETGGEVVENWGNWTLFRKRGKFEIYTDNESKIEQYTRIKNTFLAVAAAELLMSVSQWKIYSETGKYTLLCTASILSLISLICFYQVYKCNKKITILKKEIGCEIQ